MVHGRRQDEELGGGAPFLTRAPLPGSISRDGGMRSMASSRKREQPEQARLEDTGMAGLGCREWQTAVGRSELQPGQMPI